MKRPLAILLTAILLCTAGAAVGCTDKATVITVGASPTPHALILEQCRSYIESKGYTLKIVEYSDYVQPNIALSDGSLDANYFQHVPYLDSFCSEHGLELTAVAKIHFEPLGIYKGGVGTTLTALKAGDKIAVPDDETNCARALWLLSAKGVITVTNDKGLKTTVNDVDSKGLDLIPLKANLIAAQLPELAFAVINGNYAVDFSLEDSVVAQEECGSLAAETYANIVAVRTSDTDSEKTRILLEALSQPQIAEYISSVFGGLVVPYVEKD